MKKFTDEDFKGTPKVGTQMVMDALRTEPDHAVSIDDGSGYEVRFTMVPLTEGFVHYTDALVDVAHQLIQYAEDSEMPEAEATAQVSFRLEVLGLYDNT